MEYKTREQWLQAAIRKLRPRFKAHGELPKKIHALVSFPHKSPNAIGQHIPGGVSKDGAPYVSIVPTIDEPTDVLHVLMHELVHAIGISGHGARFRKVATALGLTGKMTATVPTDELLKELKALAKALGPYPHSKLTMPANRPRGGGATLVRFVSPYDDTYVLWMRPTAAEEFGAPVDPWGHKMEVRNGR